MLKRMDKVIDNLASFIVKRNGNDYGISQIDNKLKKIEEALESIDWDLYEAYLEEHSKVQYRGGSYGERLKSEEAVAVQDGHMPKGVVFDWHHHDSKEILAIYRGRAKNINGGEHEYGVGDVIEVPPGTNHKMVALEITDLIAIVIPREAGYP